MRQEEVDASYKVLNQLAPLAELDKYDPDGKENLFVVLLDSSRPPFYKSLLTPELLATTSSLRELRTSGLVARLENQANQDKNAPAADNNPATSDLGLTPAVRQHLMTVWNHVALRSFERIEVNADIEITVGLTNIHYHISNEQPFNLFLNQASALAPGSENSIFKKHSAKLKENPNALKADDPWEDSFEMTDSPMAGGLLSSFNLEKRMSAKEKDNYQGQHNIFKIPLIDRSPGGYGVEWRNEIPLQVKAGELLGLREYGRNKWSIGVVRWVHQIKGASQLGIQILAPNAIPIGIAIIHKTGGYSEYLRALQIPELRAINQPPSIITNAISFHEYNKARIYQQPQADVSYAGDRTIQLTRRLFATGAISRFGYRELLDTKAPAADAKDDFNSVWE
jgi:cyclic-di-GMP-binding protein